MKIILVLSVALSLWAAQITGEIPKYSPLQHAWALQHTPKSGLSCYRNGLRQLAGQDFQASGPYIVSAYWEQSDTLQCDYIY